MVNGQLESGEFPYDDLYVRYGFSFGPDWTVVDGIENGLSQIARRLQAVIILLCGTFLWIYLLKAQTPMVGHA